MGLKCRLKPGYLPMLLVGALLLALGTHFINRPIRADGNEPQKEAKKDSPKEEKGFFAFGRVLDLDGKPLAGVALGIGASEPDKVMHFQEMTKSDREGNFKFGPLPAGEYEIWPSDTYRADKSDREESIPLPGVFLRQPVRLGLDQVSKTVDVVQVPHVTLHGIALDSKGKAMEFCAFDISGKINGCYWDGQVEIFEGKNEASLKVPKGLEDAWFHFPGTQKQKARCAECPGATKEFVPWTLHWEKITEDQKILMHYYHAPAVTVRLVSVQGDLPKDLEVNRQFKNYEGGQGCPKIRDNDYRVIPFLFVPDEPTTFVILQHSKKMGETAALTFGEGEKTTVVITLSDGVITGATKVYGEK